MYFYGKKDPDLLSSDHDAVKDDRETLYSDR